VAVGYLVTGYIVHRLILGILVLILVSLVIFFMMRLLPGDPILILITAEQVTKYTEEEITALKQEYGLDKSLILQYGDWMSHVLRGDLGDSIIGRFDVSHEIAKRIPISVHLGLCAFVISFIVGVPVGVVCAARRGSWMDTILTLLANGGICVPIFWLGIVLIYVLAIQFGFLPTFGYTSPFEDFWMSIRQSIMPVFCLAVYPIASAARQTRSSMLEVMRQEYIRTAWSKGLRERIIITRHALKNGIIPVVTLQGMMLSHILGGEVLVETVFNIPGIGRLAVDGIQSLDYAVVQGVIMVMAVAVVLTNLIVDLCYGWIDPRIRYG
jgi:peptide/nickel transport system permease protein